MQALVTTLLVGSCLCIACSISPNRQSSTAQVPSPLLAHTLSSSDGSGWQQEDWLPTVERIDLGSPETVDPTQPGTSEPPGVTGELNLLFGSRVLVGGKAESRNPVKGVDEVPRDEKRGMEDLSLFTGFALSLNIPTAGGQTAGPAILFQYSQIGVDDMPSNFDSFGYHVYNLGLGGRYRAIRWRRVDVHVVADAGYMWWQGKRSIDKCSDLFFPCTQEYPRHIRPKNVEGPTLGIRGGVRIRTGSTSKARIQGGLGFDAGYRYFAGWVASTPIGSSWA
ncbi:MAG: hypothetical protein O7H41_15070 [Planctomycetota bacterium]|nr:hypothetical protein [Planctomycetota bacterium]